MFYIKNLNKLRNFFEMNTIIIGTLKDLLNSMNSFQIYYNIKILYLINKFIINFAFQMCTDYVTEKLFDYSRYDIIPVSLTLNIIY